MSVTKQSLAERLDSAMRDHQLPDLEEILSHDFEAALNHIVENDKPDALTVAFLGSPRPVVAKALLQLLQMAPESPSVILLNQAIYTAFQAYVPNAYQFERKLGAQLDQELKAFLKEQSGQPIMEFLTGTLYKNLFKLVPESRQWIADNFLSFSALDPAGYDHGLAHYQYMRSALNEAGLDNIVIRDRVREVLDIQMANAVVNPQFIDVLSTQAEFDNLYLAKVVRFMREQNPYSIIVQQENETTLKNFAAAFVSNAVLDKVDEIRAVIAAFDEGDHTINLDQSGANLLLDFVTLSPMASKHQLTRLYRRQILTAAEIGPRLQTMKDIDHAVRHSQLSVRELLTHAPEALQALHLAHEIGL